MMGDYRHWLLRANDMQLFRGLVAVVRLYRVPMIVTGSCLLRGGS